MRTPPENRPPTPALAAALTAIAALASLAAVPAGAQPSPCGFTNPVTQCFDQNTVGVVSLADDDEMLGAALAFGDFDGDGFDDLAVGAPGERQTANGAGLVHVFYGSADGLTVVGSDQFDQGAIAGESVEAGDGFGAALAAGDFDDDGFDDLAIGTPFEDHLGCPAGCTNSGVVHVVYGAAGGLDLPNAETFTMDDLGIVQHPAGDGHEFGSVLAAGHVGFPTGEDLLVCAPGFGIEGGDTGGCYMVFGSPAGLNHGAAATVGNTGSSENDRLASDAVAFNGFAFFGSPLTDDSTLPDTGLVHVNFIVGQDTSFEERHVSSDQQNHPETRFGHALAAGDFDANGFQDLAVGGPGRGSGNVTDGGIVYVVLRESGPFDPQSLESQALTQDDLLGPGEVEIGDATGSALGAGDFDGDGFDDLAIGAPGEDPFNIGQVLVAFGGDGGIDLDRVVGFFEGGLGGTSVTGDSLGQVLATGDVDGDGRDELAIGVPLNEVDGHHDAGMVYIHYFPDPTPSPDIFADGFESGDTSAWSEVVP